MHYFVIQNLGMKNIHILTIFVKGSKTPNFSLIYWYIIFFYKEVICYFLYKKCNLIVLLQISIRTNEINSIKFIYLKKIHILYCRLHNLNTYNIISIRAYFFLTFSTLFYIDFRKAVQYFTFSVQRFKPYYTTKDIVVKAIIFDSLSCTW